MSTLVVDIDTRVIVTLIDKTNGSPVYTEETSAELLGGCLTRLRITWNALAYSGGSRWVHPTTGHHYQRGLSIRAYITHPENDEQLEIDVRPFL